MKRPRLAAPLLAALALGSSAGAQPGSSADTYHDAEDRPASSRSAAFAAAYRAELEALRRDVDARRQVVSPGGIQRLLGIRQRADELDEQAGRLGALDRGSLRRAQRGLRRELQRLRRELDRTQ